MSVRANEVLLYTFTNMKIGCTPFAKRNLYAKYSKKEIFIRIPQNYKWAHDMDEQIHWSKGIKLLSEYRIYSTIIRGFLSLK